MATPLARLLQDVLHEPDVRAQFAAGPESFFADHGYDHLDAADVREALFVLADGAEPEAAGDYQSGADAIGDTPGLAELDGIAGAAAGLASAVARILGAPQLDDPTDPAELDDLADRFGGADADDPGPDPSDHDDRDDGDDADADDDAADGRGPDADGDPADPADTADTADRSALGHAGSSDDASTDLDDRGLDDVDDLELDDLELDDLDLDGGLPGATTGATTGLDDLDALDRPTELFSSDVPRTDPVPDDAPHGGELGDGWDDLI
ncbi:MAG: hypothetical protein KDB40_02570 [Acidimicrobiales bacterium]|nr:hypothetical protein [Acidimicrobiales bacterium]MCB9393261.1 hypothetical protein [Acidimicrobiaceae bacterium]